MRPEPRRLPPGRATWRQQLPRPPRPLDLDRHAAAALQVEPAISSSSTAAAAVAARGHWARRSIESQGIQALDHRVRNKGSVERRTPFGPALRSPRWTAPPIRSTRPGTRKWVAESRQKEFAMCGGPAVQARRPVVGTGGCLGRWGVAGRLLAQLLLSLGHVGVQIAGCHISSTSSRDDGSSAPCNLTYDV